jgi:hypothetical protein
MKAKPHTSQYLGSGFVYSRRTRGGQDKVRTLLVSENDPYTGNRQRSIAQDMPSLRSGATADMLKQILRFKLDLKRNSHSIYSTINTTSSEPEPKRATIVQSK